MPKKNKKSLLARFNDGSLPTKMDFRDLIESMVHISDDGIERTFSDGLLLLQAKSTEDNISQLLSLYRVDDMQTALWTLHIDPVSGNLQWNSKYSQPALTLARQVGTDNSKQVGIGINQAQPAYELDVAGVAAMRARIGQKGQEPVFADGQWHTIKANVSGCVALEVTAAIRDVNGAETAIMHTIVTKAFDEQGNFSYHRAGDGKTHCRMKLRWTPAEHPLPGQKLAQYDLQIFAEVRTQPQGWTSWNHTGRHGLSIHPFFNRFSIKGKRRPKKIKNNAEALKSNTLRMSQIDYHICDLWFDPEMIGCLKNPQQPLSAIKPVVDLGVMASSQFTDSGMQSRKERKNLLRIFDDGMQPTTEDFAALVTAMFNIEDDGMDRSSVYGLQLHQLKNSVGSSKSLMSFTHSEASQQVFWSLNFGVSADDLEICGGNASAPAWASFCNLAKPDPNVPKLRHANGDTHSSGQLGLGIQQLQPRYALDIDGVIAATGRIGITKKVLADGHWQSLLEKEDLCPCNAYEVVAGVGKKSSGKYAILHAYALNIGQGPGNITMHQAHYDSVCDCLELRWFTPDREGSLPDLQIRVASSYYDVVSSDGGSAGSNLPEVVEIQCYLTNLWFNAPVDLSPPQCIPEPASDLKKVGRRDLCDLFKAGHLPKEEDFATLINAMLNLMDDGVERSDVNGLCLRQDASDNAQTASRLLSIYSNDMPQQAAWFLQLDKDSDLSAADCLFFFGAANPFLPLLSLSQRSVPGEESDYEPGVQVGVNTSSPAHELDVNGTICSRGRIGRKGSESVLADGNWHTIRKNLYGCNAFEITAGAGKKYSGQYAVMHAFALNAFQSHHHISYHGSHYGAQCNKLELRWVAAQGSGSEDLFRPYDLQLRVAASYGADVWVQYFVTDLWFDPAMSGVKA